MGHVSPAVSVLGSTSQMTKALNVRTQVCGLRRQYPKGSSTNMIEARSAVRSQNVVWRVTVLLLAVAMSTLLAGCGEEGGAEAQGASSLDVAPNDMPLNPPALRFRVGPDGHVGASPERKAEAGEAVALVLDNDSEDAVKLVLLAPDGSQVFALTAPPAERRDGRAMPRTTGRHHVEIFPVGERAKAQRFSVDVSEN